MQERMRKSRKKWRKMSEFLHNINWNIVQYAAFLCNIDQYHGRIWINDIFQYHTIDIIS